MVDTVNTQVLHSGSRRYVVRLTNNSDGTGESAVQKVDISGLVGPDGTAPTRTAVEEIFYDVNGFEGVLLAWDHTTDDEIALLAGNGYIDWRTYGGTVDPASTGGTGDIVLTTNPGGTAGAAGDTYDITLVLRLKD